MIEKKKVIESILGPATKSGSEFLFYCKTCGHYKKKLSVNFQKDCWKCWICDDAGYDLSRLIKRWGTFQQKQEWSSVDSTLDLSQFREQFFLAFYGSSDEEEEQVITLPEEFQTLSTKKTTYNSLAARNYLKSRNINQEDILNWRIGYASKGEYRNRIIIPSFNSEGRVNFFVGRTYIDDSMKYKNPQVSKDLIYNELFVDWINDVVIVEGVFDAIKIPNSVPILGSTLTQDSKLFKALARHKPRVFLALDSDAEKKSLKLIIKLLEYGVEVYKVNTFGYDDVAEMPIQVFRKRKSESIKMDLDTLLLYKTLSI
jgi:ribosomal protein L23